ncbi:hypothetical protein TNCV_1344571 [Trichonephila clavipes]|nr:hypothetical protein TNCV_1344571 [Trichonephila clavipes]
MGNPNLISDPRKCRNFADHSGRPSTTWTVTKAYPRSLGVRKERFWCISGFMDGWGSRFGAGLVHPRLWVRPQTKSGDFYDAKNRQRSYRMIIRHDKDPLSACLA